MPAIGEPRPVPDPQPLWEYRWVRRWPRVKRYIKKQATWLLSDGHLEYLDGKAIKSEEKLQINRSNLEDIGSILGLAYRIEKKLLGAFQRAWAMEYRQISKTHPPTACEKAAESLVAPLKAIWGEAVAIRKHWQNRWDSTLASIQISKQDRDIRERALREAAGT